MTQPTNYLHFDSSFRDRLRYPRASHFTVKCEGTNNYTNTTLSKINSKDSVAGGSLKLELKWSGAALKLYGAEDPRTDPFWNSPTSNTITMATSATTLGGADGGGILIFGPSASVRTQFVKDYYIGLSMDYTYDSTNYTCRVEDYTFIDDGLCQFRVSSLLPNVAIPAGTEFTMTDPSLLSVGKIFVPNGATWSNAYPSTFIIFNHTLNQWRPIDNYDGPTQILQAYEGPKLPNYPQTANIETTGPLLTWTNRHTYSIRDLNGGNAPVFNSNNGNVLEDASPVSTTNNTACWFEPKQYLTPTSFNLGPNNEGINADSMEGSWIEMAPPSGGSSAASKVNYQDVLTGGSKTTAVLTVGPNALWTQEDFYCGMSMTVDYVGITITTNTGATANFPAASNYSVVVGTNSTYANAGGGAGTGTGMVINLSLSNTGTDDVVSANITTPGSGYVAGDTITISQTNFRVIVADGNDETVTTSAVLTLRGPGILHAVRTVNTYDSEEKTIKFDPDLDSALVAGDKVSFHPCAENEIRQGKTTVRYPRPSWRVEPMIETGQITKFCNVSGTTAVEGAAGALSLVLTGDIMEEYRKNNYFSQLWISWIQNGGCYARFIQTSTYDKSTAQTTVNFIRGLGGTVSGVPSITAGGSAYNAPSIVATTLNAGTTLGGSGLTINIVSVDDSAIGELLTILPNTGASTNFIAQSYTMSTLPANCTYPGAGTGMTLTISTLAVGLNDVKTVAVLTKGSGYLSGETLTINLSQMKTITGIATLTMASDVVLTLTVAATTGAVTGATVNNPGNHYSVNDVVTLVGGGNDATLTIGALSAVPADTPWSICSGIFTRVSQNSSQSGLSTYFNMQQWLLMTFAREHATSFTLTTSSISHQAPCCYEIELITLILPNEKLKVGNGGRLAFYPYVLVSLESVGSAGGLGPHLISSNNPHAVHAMFICAIDDVTHPNTATFLKIDGDGMVQTLKFNPRTDLTFRVYLPNGTTLRYLVPDTLPPSAPTPSKQISATFAMKRIG
jgi:hypothetical protein